MFPATIPVVHTPLMAVTQDSRGNDVLSFKAPVSLKAIAFGDHKVENTDGHTSQVVAEADLALPTMPVDLRDRFTVNNLLYEVVGVRDNNGGFHGWKPGVVAELKRVTG